MRAEVALLGDDVPVNSDEPVKVDLTVAEQDLLVQGLAQWGGPASPTDALARAIGFQGKDDLWQGIRTHPARRLAPRRAHDAGRLAAHPARDRDRLRSDVVGAGTDWPVTTGLSDQETVAALRAIQKKIGRALYRAGPTADKRPRRAAVFPFHCSLVCVVCRC